MTDFLVIYGDSTTEVNSTFPGTHNAVACHVYKDIAIESVLWVKPDDALSITHQMSLEKIAMQGNQRVSTINQRIGIVMLNLRKNEKCLLLCIVGSTRKSEQVGRS